MAVTGVWKIAVIGLGPQGEAIVNTFYYGPDGADATVDPALVASAFDGALPNQIADLVSSDWHYYKTTALCVHGTNVGFGDQNSDSAPLVGVLNNGVVPMSVCIIGKTKANNIGRHSHGRKFFSPVDPAYVDVDGKFIDAGTWAADWHTLAQTNVTPAATPFHPVLWDPVNQQAVKITSDSVARICGQQKRRRLRLPN